jgi:hypothetical protein
MKAGIIAVFLMVVGGWTNSNPAPALPVERPLPKNVASVLAAIKAGTSIPVLLPTKLPRPFSDAKNAVVQKITADEYALALYYEMGAGDAGFAAFFAAKNNASYSPRELPDVREVKLVGDIVGFFRPVSCGGSCAPANLWWKRGSAIYQVQLKMPSALSQEKQLKVITAVADSAILAGPR